MKTKLFTILLGMGMVFTMSCTKYPPSSERLTEDLAIITQYDTKCDFNTYKTFSIAAYIVKVTDKDTTNLNNSTAIAILDEIAKNMEARGFVKVTAPAKPDFGINVTYYQNTNVYTYSYGYYWGYPYYGWYYPYYPVYYTSYTTGMANVELADLKDVSVIDPKIYLRWNAYIRGLVTGTHTNAELIQSIDQAFIQTPQLKTSALQ